MKKSKGWSLLMGHKGVTFTEEEKKDIEEASAAPPVIHTGLQYSKKTFDRLKDQWYEDWDPNYTKPMVFVKATDTAGTSAGSGSRQAEALHAHGTSSGSGSRQAETPYPQVTVTPAGAEDAEMTVGPADYIIPGRPLTEAERLRPWKWQEVATGVPGESYVTVYDWDRCKVHKVPPKWISQEALDEALAYMENREAQRHHAQHVTWLKEHWVPLIREKRSELRAEQLEELDKRGKGHGKKGKGKSKGGDLSLIHI